MASDRSDQDHAAAWASAYYRLQRQYERLWIEHQHALASVSINEAEAIVADYANREAAEASLDALSVRYVT